MPQVIRPLSGLERIWIAAGREAHMVIQCVMRPPPVPEERWRSALDALAETRPGARMVCRGRLRKARWEADPRPIPLRTVDAWDGASAAPFLEAPLDPLRGPSAELVLAGDFVVWRIHHALTDGQGLWGMAQALLDAAAGRPLTPVAAGPETELDLTAGVPLPEYADPALDARSPFGERTAPYSTERAWRHRRLPVTRQITARAIAALVDHAQAPLRISVPVDLRRYRPGLVSDANLTGVAHVEVSADASPNGVHARVVEAVEAHRAAAHVRAADGVRGVPLWLMTWFARRSGRAAMQAGRVAVSATVSNMGRLPLSFAGQPVPAFVLQPANPTLPVFVALVGGHDCVDCTVTAPRGVADEAALDGLLNSIETGLVQATIVTE